MKNHPKIEFALNKYGLDNFQTEAEKLLYKHPKHRIVLGLFGGPSTGKYRFRYTAGRKYPRYAVRYERNKGYIGISKHSGPYLYISI